MKNFFIFICLLYFCISSCYPPCKGNFTQSFEMTLKVFDMDNNPVKNREIIMFTIPVSFTPYPEPSYKFDKLSAFTDNFGIVKVAYTLNADCEATFSRAFIVKEDSLFIATNFVKQSIDINQKSALGVLKLSDTIRMDSLVPFKIRIKSSKNNISKLFINVSSTYPFAYPHDTLFRNFKLSLNGEPISSQSLDTTFSTNVYSKRYFYIKNDLRLNDNSIIHGQPYYIERNFDRKVVLLYEIN